MAGVTHTLTVTFTGDPVALALTVESAYGSQAVYTYGAGTVITRTSAGNYSAAVPNIGNGTYGYTWQPSSPYAQVGGTFIVGDMIPAVTFPGPFVTVTGARLGIPQAMPGAMLLGDP